MNRSDTVYTGRLVWRHRLGRAFEGICLVSTWSGLLVLVVLLSGVVWQASGQLNWSFLTNFDSRFPERAGIHAGLWGSLWLVVFTALFSVPVGIGAALYLEEYASQNWLTRFIQLNLANLAGVPSVVYGILGLTVFVRMFGLFASGSYHMELALGVVTLRVPLPLGRSLIAGALTLSLLILPVVIIAAQEALRSIPASIRHASYALGATRWQTVRHQVLPPATPGILTGVILALSRAIGETAPLIMIGAFMYIAFTPGDISTPADIVRNPQGVLEAPFDDFTALPIQIFNWATFPRPEYQQCAAAGIVVLLAVLLLMNAVAVLTRHRFRQRIRW